MAQYANKYYALDPNKPLLKLSPAETRDNQLRAKRIFLQNGFNETQANLLLGFIDHESGGSWNPKQLARAKNDTGQGLFQITHKSRQKAFIDKRNKLFGYDPRIKNVTDIPLEEQVTTWLNERPDVMQVARKIQDPNKFFEAILQGQQNGGGTWKSRASMDQLYRLYGQNNIDTYRRNILRAGNKYKGISEDQYASAVPQARVFPVSAPINLPPAPSSFSIGDLATKLSQLDFLNFADTPDSQREQAIRQQLPVQYNIPNAPEVPEEPPALFDMLNMYNSLLSQDA